MIDVMIVINLNYCIKTEYVGNYFIEFFFSNNRQIYKKKNIMIWQSKKHIYFEFSEEFRSSAQIKWYG